MAFLAKFRGVCAKCSQPIHKGTPIAWSRKERGKAYHEACATSNIVPISTEKAMQAIGASATPEEEQNKVNQFLAGTVGEICASASAPVSAPPAHAPVRPSAPAGDIMGMLADSLLPFLEQRIAGKVDEDIVLELIQSEVRAALGNCVLPTRVEVTNTAQEVTWQGTTHKQFPLLLRTLGARLPNNHHLNVWIAGPTGSGKTTAAEQAAQALGLKFAFTGAIDTPYPLLGYRTANGETVRTLFRECYEHGGVFLFDEVDGSSASAVLALNAALANGQCAFPDGMVARHPDFICIAAANTWGLGATHEYVGRTKLDAAFLNRFGAKIYWEYDNALETSTCGNPTWAGRVQEVRARIAERGIKVIVSPRSSYDGAALLATGMLLSEVEMLTLQAGMTAEQWAMVQA